MPYQRKWYLKDVLRSLSSFFSVTVLGVDLGLTISKTNYKTVPIKCPIE